VGVRGARRRDGLLGRLDQLSQRNDGVAASRWRQRLVVVFVHGDQKIGLHSALQNCSVNVRACTRRGRGGYGEREVDKCFLRSIV
jgi:hypothetical protein